VARHESLFVERRDPMNGSELGMGFTELFQELAIGRRFN